MKEPRRIRRPPNELKSDFHHLTFQTKSNILYWPSADLHERTRQSEF